MYLAYSAISQTDHNLHDRQQSQTDNERLLRYQAYSQTCEKYRQEIAAIQKYLPGWLPKFK